MFRKAFPPLAAASALLATSLSGAGVRADTIRLDNGDRLTGDLVRLEDGTLTFDPAYGARAEIAAAHVVLVATDGVVTVRFRDGRDATGRLVANDLAEMRLAGAPSAPASFGMAEIAAIYPGTRDLRHAFRWKGTIDLGLIRTRGNSESDEMHVSGEAIGRSDRHRITLRAALNRKVDRGTAAVDNAMISAKHDRFVSEKLYFYTNASAARDRLAGVDLRATLGTGAGYQIFDSDETELSVEAGPSYIREILKADGTQDQITARWSIDFRQLVVPEIARFFHHQEGFLDVRNPGHVLLHTRTGFRFPMRAGFHATAELDFDLDTDPAPGKGQTDRTYLLTVGYGF